MDVRAGLDVENTGGADPARCAHKYPWQQPPSGGSVMIALASNLFSLIAHRSNLKSAYALQCAYALTRLAE
jgi:hypothetical protein